MLTDLETIKKIIFNDVIFIPEVRNERITLTLYDASQLQHKQINENSEDIKRIATFIPHADSKNPVTLNSNIEVTLDFQKIVWDTVVVADSLALLVIYLENIDYIIDYDNGTIRRTSVGSAIPSGGQVYVWYQPFAVLSRSSDYNIDYNAGTINRRAGTLLPDGCTIYCDYSHTQITFSDELIKELIYEMESFISPRLKAGYTLDSPDPGLKSAATNFVLYLFCLSQDLKELSIAGSSNSDDLAERWAELSDKYLTTANTLFSKYVNVSSLQFGGLVQNRWVTNRSRTMQSPSVPITTRRH